jgi:hypothetical protein
LLLGCSCQEMRAARCFERCCMLLLLLLLRAVGSGRVHLPWGPSVGTQQGDRGPAECAGSTLQTWHAVSNIIPFCCVVVTAAQIEH